MASLSLRAAAALACLWSISSSWAQSFQTATFYPYKCCQSERLWAYPHYCPRRQAARNRILVRRLQSDRRRSCCPEPTPPDDESGPLDSFDAGKHGGVSGCNPSDADLRRPRNAGEPHGFPGHRFSNGELQCGDIGYFNVGKIVFLGGSGLMAAPA
jgi:hypothetical protein